MLGRLPRSADFESVLATPIRARSAHFAAHHLAGAPQARRRPPAQVIGRELSTGHSDACTQAVDDHANRGCEQWWFGTVVPKRYARQATTRSLLRRQIRGALARHHSQLAHGMWLVRLRAPFDTNAFRSAASGALRSAARAELDDLLTRAAA